MKWLKNNNKTKFVSFYKAYQCFVILWGYFSYIKNCFKNARNNKNADN